MIDNSKFRYPSWREWWFSIFPNGLSCPSLCMIRDNTPYCDNMTCDECISMPIPDDIAKKLGIAPIKCEDETNE